MSSRLQVLRSVLDALNVPVSVKSVDDRIIMQKAVYLAQVFGVPMGYSYGWYVRGPYSPSLTQDYYALARESIQSEPSRKSFRPGIEERLQRVRQAMKAPNAQISIFDWVELVGSVAFLMMSERLNDSQIADRIARDKPWLQGHTADALRALNDLKGRLALAPQR